MLRFQLRSQATKGLIAIIVLTVSTMSAFADKTRFVDLHTSETGRALEAYALKKADKSFDEGHSLANFTDYYRLDEFDQRAKRDEYLAEIRAAFDEAAVSIESVDYFVIDGSIKLGDFNFEAKSFPMLNFYKREAGYRIDIERKPGMDPAWYYKSAPFGADAISNYRPRVETPGRGVLNPYRTSQFQFDWAPVLANFAFREAPEGKEFLDTFGRRPHVRIISSLERVEETKGYRRFHFKVSCLVFLARDNGAISARMMAPPDGNGEPCNAYFKQFGKEGWSFLGHTPLD